MEMIWGHLRCRPVVFICNLWQKISEPHVDSEEHATLWWLCAGAVVSDLRPQLLQRRKQLQRPHLSPWARPSAHSARTRTPVSGDRKQTPPPTSSLVPMRREAGERHRQTLEEREGEQLEAQRGSVGEREREREGAGPRHKHKKVVMGNTDSHTSFVSAAKPSCSLRSSSREEEAPSARSWWRSSQGGCRSRGRSCQNQNSSWHYEHGPRGGSMLRAASPQRNSRGSCRSQFGYPENGGEGNGIGGERKSVESGGSPKVLLSKDGSMRVEFSNSRVDPMEPQGLTGVPAISTTAASSVAEPLLRTSKGSSLSSDSSWYDSPWGGSTELADNVFVCGQIADNPTYSSTHTEVSSTPQQGVFNTFFSAQVEVVSPGFNSTLLFPAAGYNTCSSRRTEDSGIGDSVILQPDLRDFSLVSSPAASLDSVYSSHNTLPAFPTAPHPPRAASSSTLPDDVSQEEEGFSSLTLPCRRAESTSTAPATANNRKDFLKSRIRQLSDWTGSLSRKKRRIQEPSEVSVTGLSCELVGRSAASTSDLLHPPCGSRGLNHISDAQRRNIYENFMQELETSCSGAADQEELSDEEEEQEEEQEEEEDMDGGVELGGIEQLDVLFEKEQGVVRRAGWLFFKPLITVNKDGKMELVARRRWRHYWTNDLKTNDLKTNDLKTNDVKTNDLKTNDLKTNDLKTNDLKTNDLKTNDLQTNDLKTNDLKTNDLKTNDLKTNDLKTNDLKTNDLKTNDL
ncbi:unnamed protein product [Pleuronectes platessa]|uniref:Uncharacterized protein n=1 Tax=Pleuronectes platessa TaxID=8262 RepID=A0A9N7UW31_PLEPL|nr:unnamed protein product [Pleuronectes platessa]